MRRKVTYDPDRDYYVVLGIKSHATAGQIRQAYRRSVRECHPDLNPHRAAWATHQIQLVNEAYDVLRDPARRQEYDRQRWPHIPTRPPPQAPSQTGGGGAPAYDPDRPWWEQVVTTVPREWAARRGHRARQRAAPARPFWLVVSDWLRRLHLGALEHPWLTLVGLWRSPYAGLIGLLGTLLALNVAVIIYAFITPEGSAWMADVFKGDPNTPTPRPTLTATPDRVNLLCSDPGVQIHLPVEYDVVGDVFSVYGTIQHPDLWHYTLHVGYLGPSLSRNPVVEDWRLVRAPPINQTLPESPVEEDVLTAEPVDLTGQPSGYYVVRLRVVLRNRDLLPPCDVIVQR